MAQTGYTPISIYYSSTATNVPTAGNLVAGELAINTADGVLYYKDSSGVVQSIASKAGNSGSFTNLAYTGTLTGGTGVVNLGSGQFYKDASGNVGIGGTPDSKLGVFGSAGSNPYSHFKDASGADFYIQSVGNSDCRAGTASNHPWLFMTNSTERMRITSTGDLCINATTSSGSKLYMQGASTAAGSTPILGIQSTASTNPRQFQIGIDETNGWTYQDNLQQGIGATPHRFYSYTSYQGQYNGGGAWFQGNNSAAWSISSDQRLKKNIVDNTIGLDAISKIQVRNFEYRTKNEVTDLPESAVIDIQGIQLGAIAQELQMVLPDCIKEELNGVLSVDTTNLTWYLINAVKELNAKVTALEAQLSKPAV